MADATHGFDFRRVRRVVCRLAAAALGLPADRVVFAGQGSPEPQSGPWIEVRRASGPNFRGLPSRRMVRRPESVLFELDPGLAEGDRAAVRAGDAVLEAVCGSGQGADWAAGELLARAADLEPGRVHFDAAGPGAIRASESPAAPPSSAAGAIFRHAALEGAEATPEGERWLEEERQAGEVRFLLVAHLWPASDPDRPDGAAALARILDALREPWAVDLLERHGVRRTRGQRSGEVRYSPRQSAAQPRVEERHEVDLWVAATSLRCRDPEAEPSGPDLAPPELGGA
jgi:hypothetical protein